MITDRLALALASTRVDSCLASAFPSRRSQARAFGGLLESISVFSPGRGDILLFSPASPYAQMLRSPSRFAGLDVSSACLHRAALPSRRALSFISARPSPPLARASSFCAHHC